MTRAHVDETTLPPRINTTAIRESLNQLLNIEQYEPARDPDFHRLKNIRAKLLLLVLDALRFPHRQHREQRLNLVASFYGDRFKAVLSDPATEYRTEIDTARDAWTTLLTLAHELAQQPGQPSPFALGYNMYNALYVSAQQPYSQVDEKKLEYRLREQMEATRDLVRAQEFLHAVAERQQKNLLEAVHRMAALGVSVTLVFNFWIEESKFMVQGFRHARTLVGLPPKYWAVERVEHRWKLGLHYFPKQLTALCFQHELRNIWTAFVRGIDYTAFSQPREGRAARQRSSISRVGDALRPLAANLVAALDELVPGKRTEGDRGAGRRVFRARPSQ